jgi:NADPH-dependent 2,4-dienoyl-CoA reductase/sulfur reductase-like enzyme
LREGVIKTMNDIVSRPPPLDTSADAQLRSEAAAVATHAERKPRIVIVGGGFGGVAAARALRKSDAEVFLIDSLYRFGRTSNIRSRRRVQVPGQLRCS